MRPNMTTDPLGGGFTSNEIFGGELSQPSVRRATVSGLGALYPPDILLPGGKVVSFGPDGVPRVVITPTGQVQVQQSGPGTVAVLPPGYSEISPLPSASPTALPAQMATAASVSPAGLPIGLLSSPIVIFGLIYWLISRRRSRR